MCRVGAKSSPAVDVGGSREPLTARKDGVCGGWMKIASDDDIENSRRASLGGRPRRRIPTFEIEGQLHALESSVTGMPPCGARGSSAVVLSHETLLRNRRLSRVLTIPCCQHQLTPSTNIAHHVVNRRRDQL